MPPNAEKFADDQTVRQRIFLCLTYSLSNYLDESAVKMCGVLFWRQLFIIGILAYAREDKSLKIPYSL